MVGIRLLYSISSQFYTDLKKQTYYLLANAPVNCVSGPLGAGDTGDIAGLKCRDLIFEILNFKT